MTGPRHSHPEYRTVAESHRLEDRVEHRFRDVDEGMQKLADKVDKLTERMTQIFVGAGLLAFIIPLAAPFIRDLLNITP